MFDLSVFASVETWVQLITLIFLEMVLGVDNLVFIAITTDRLPDNRKALGRRFGLMAALVMRVILLCFASWIISLHLTLVTLPFAFPGMDPEISGKDLILLVGGGYLIVKGIQELMEKLSLREEQEELLLSDEQKRRIGLLQAVGTIAVMDMIFSLDSVITAVGMVDVLLIMILAVMIAVITMIVFANVISEFINANPEVKILALGFIVAVGAKLVLESLGVELHIEGMEFDGMDLMLYFGLALSLILTVLQMNYNKGLSKLKALHIKDQVEADDSSDQNADLSNQPGQDDNQGSSSEPDLDKDSQPGQSIDQGTNPNISPDISPDINKL